MSEKPRFRASPSMLVAVAAVVLAMAGSATAASVITSKQIKDGTIRTKDLSKAVRRQLARKGTPGPAGAPGPQGPKGAPGAPAAALWAVVTSDGGVARGSHVTGAGWTSIGQYEVTFDRNVSNCAYVGNVGGVGSQTVQGYLAAARHPSNPNAVYVEIFNHPPPNAAYDALPFHLAVYC